MLFNELVGIYHPEIRGFLDGSSAFTTTLTTVDFRYLSAKDQQVAFRPGFLRRVADGGELLTPVNAKLKAKILEACQAVEPIVTDESAIVEFQTTTEEQLLIQSFAVTYPGEEVVVAPKVIVKIPVYLAREENMLDRQGDAFDSIPADLARFPVDQ